MEKGVKHALKHEYVSPVMSKKKRRMSNPTNSVYNLKIIVLKKSWLVGETHFEKILQ